MNIRAFRSQLRKLERQAERFLEQSTVCCGVTIVQCHTLLEMAEAGPVNLTELADRMELDKSTVSRTVDALVRTGLVERKEDPGNRRAVILTLSDSGKRKVGEIHGVSDRFYQRVLAKLPADRVEQLAGCLELLVDALSEVDGSRCGCPSAPAGVERS